MTSTFRYRAFISYSHRDKAWGDWLHKALESYRVPKRLVGTAGRDGEVPARLFPIFRDREELPTSDDLSSQIQNGLKESEYLIVVCSPHAAQSRWVNEEILAYKRLGREDRILAIIVGGEPNADDTPGGTAAECFPPALKYRLGLDGQLSQTRTEPIAADARPLGDGKENAKLKLIAGLLGVGFDALKQRDLEAQRKRTRFYQTIATAMALLAVGAGIAAYFAITNAAEAHHQRDAVLIRESRYLADAAGQAIRKNDPETALLLADEGLPHDLVHPDRPVVDEAVDAARAALTADGPSGVAGGNASALVLSKEGDRFVAGFRSGDVAIWRIAPLGQAGFAHYTNSSVKSLALSPDGRRMLVGFDNASVALGDATTGKLLHWLRPAGGDNTSYNVGFSSDGAYAYAAGGPAPIDRIDAWRISDYRKTADFVSGAGSRLNALALPDGHSILSAGDDGVLHCWDLAENRERFSNANLGRIGAFIFVLAANPSSTLVLSVQDGGAAMLWHVAANHLDLVTTISGVQQTGAIAWSRDGTEFAIEDKDDNARERIFQVRESASDPGGYVVKPLNTFEASDISPVFQTAGGRVRGFSQDGSKLITRGPAEDEISEWDVRSGRSLNSFSFRGRKIHLADWTDDLRVIVLATGEGIAVWRRAPSTMYRFTEPSTVIGFDFAEHYFVARTAPPIGQGTGMFHAWDLADGARSLHQWPYARPYMDEDLDAKHKALLLYGPELPGVGVFDLKTGAVIGGSVTERFVLNQARFDSDNHLVISERDGTARTIDQGDSFARPMVRHLGTYARFVCNVGCAVAAALSDDDDVWVWWPELESREPVKIAISWSNVTPVAITPDGTGVLVGGPDGQLGLFDSRTGAKRQSYFGLSGSIATAAFSADGRYMIAGGGDRFAVIWKVATGAIVRRLGTHDDALTEVALSSEGSLALSRSEHMQNLWLSASGIPILDLPARVLPGDIDHVSFNDDLRAVRRILVTEANVTIENFPVFRGVGYSARNASALLNLPAADVTAFARVAALDELSDDERGMFGLDPNTHAFTARDRCDILAGHPQDPDRQSQGIEHDSLDVKAALPACQAAVVAHPDIARYWFELGRVLDKTSKPDDALAAFSKASDAGYAMAAYDIAMLKLEPHWRGHDLAGARSILDGAYRAGLPVAGWELANLEWNGIGGPVDREAAIRLWQETNFYKSEDALVEIFRNGEGPAKKDPALALYHQIRAAALSEGANDHRWDVQARGTLARELAAERGVTFVASIARRALRSLY